MDAQGPGATRWFLVVGIVVLLGGLGTLALARSCGPIVKVSDLRNVRRREPMRVAGLKSLTTMLVDRILQKGGYPPYGGRALVLSVIPLGMLDPGEPGALDVFFEPGDPARNTRPSVEEYRALTEARLLEGSDLRRFTSYVGRRVWAGPEPGVRGQPLVAYVHPQGADVGFVDGRVEHLDRAELGLGPDDPVVVGPTSRSPLLRLLAE